MDRRTSQTARASVLVLEDDLEFGGFLAAVCRERGFTATNVASPDEACLRMEKNPCDVLVADLNLRGLDCIDVVRRIKAAWPDVTVVAMTALGSGEEAARARDAGASEYLVKPFDWEELVLRIERALDRRDTSLEYARARRAVH